MILGEIDAKITAVAAASASRTDQAEAEAEVEVVVLDRPMLTQDAPSSLPNAFF